MGALFSTTHDHTIKGDVTERAAQAINNTNSALVRVSNGVSQSIVAATGGLASVVYDSTQAIQNTGRDFINGLCNIVQNLPTNCSHRIDVPTCYSLRVDVPTEFSLATNHATYHRFDAPTDFRVDANAVTHHTIKVDTSKDIASVLKVLAVAVLIVSIGYAYSVFSLVPSNIFGAVLFVLAAAALIVWALDQQESVKAVATRIWSARRVTADVEYQLHIGAIAANLLLCLICKKNADLLEFYGFMTYTALVIGIAEALKMARMVDAYGAHINATAFFFFAVHSVFDLVLACAQDRSPKMRAGLSRPQHRTHSTLRWHRSLLKAPDTKVLTFIITFQGFHQRNCVPTTYSSRFLFT